MVYIVGWQDQVKDLIMDTIGITISSLKKEERRLVTSAASLVLMIGLGVFLFSRR
jgi:hypothetical protein